MSEVCYTPITNNHSAGTNSPCRPTLSPDEDLQYTVEKSQSIFS